jgi:hypothetical protein
MARSLDARLARLEADLHRHRLRLIAATAAQYGLTRDALLEEARAFFALPLAEQLAEVDRAEADLRREGFSDADLAHIRETLTRDYRPMD